MALPINIENLINKTIVESERIEFKADFNPLEILHSICAFANDMNNWGGGYIIIGIEEKDGTPVLPPIGLELMHIDAIQKKIVELCYNISPTYCPIMSPEVVHDKNILVLYAPGGDNRPYKALKSLGKDKNEKCYWVRKGSITTMATQQDEIHLLEIAQKLPFDDRVNHQSTIEDLNLNVIQSFLKEVKSSLYEESTKISFEELCRKMNIVRGSTEDLHPINVGLLIFSENPSKFFRGSITEIIVYNDDVGDDFTESKFSGPLHQQLRDALNFIRNNIIKEKITKVSNVAESQRHYNYPYEALEESIANAIFHRSYENQNPIEINIRKDRIEIVSYPGPLPPLNNQLLREERVVARYYRNRRIGDFLKELKLTEGRGTGFPKIRKSMKLNGSPEPTFKTDDDVTYFLTILPIHRSFIELKLNASMISILTFCQKPKSKKEILEYIGLTNKFENAERHIRPLLDAGYLEYQYPHLPSTPKQRYHITAVGAETLKNT